MAVVPGGREAVTEYQVIGGGGGYTLLALHPRTGRTHQIRAHLAYLRLPIAGDLRYGGRHRSGRAAPTVPARLPDCVEQADGWPASTRVERAAGGPGGVARRGGIAGEGLGLPEGVGAAVENEAADSASGNAS